MQRLFIGLFETFVYGSMGGMLFAVLYNRFTQTFKTA